MSEPQFRPVRELLEGYQLAHVRVGQSSAQVLRASAKDRPTLFLKRVAAARDTESLKDEADRLAWMRAADLPVPAVLGYWAEHGGEEFLLLEGLPGANAEALCRTSDIPALIDVLGAGLRLLHETPDEKCPFKRPLASVIALAEQRVKAGAVDEADFDSERQGRSAADLLRELQDAPSFREDLVFTHGDYCLPNVILEPDGRMLELSGFVDCGRAGVADRYQDLALAARTIAGNIGAEWVHRFFDSYGISRPDGHKLAYYQLLDEFF